MGYILWGRKESDMTEQLTHTQHTHKMVFGDAAFEEQSEMYHEDVILMIGLVPLQEKKKAKSSVCLSGTEG